MGSASEPSASSSEGVGGIDQEYSDEELFEIAQNLVYSPSRISISLDEFQLLSIADTRWEEVDTKEIEFEQELSSSVSSSSKKSNSQWKGFLHKLKKKPSLKFSAFQPNKIPTILNTFQNIPSLQSLTKSPINRFTRRGKRNTTHSKAIQAPQLDGDICGSFESSWKNFTLSDLELATNDFSEENVIGEGGYSIVYKGLLEDGTLVAVKKLTTGDAEQMATDYLSELGILVHIDHPNVANVIGYGVEGGMHLVLPLSPHGSLEYMLTESGKILKWSHRYKIAIGSAQALAYLHEDCQRRIIHRDIKAANVLLTETFEPQISDFGLAKWLPEQWSHLTISQFEGTFGYLPPEFFMHGTVDEKTDVYAYGVLLLEIITGRPALDESHNSVVMWANPLIINKKMKELVDPSLNNMYDSEQLSCMIMVSSSCIQQIPSERPKMSQVVKMLQSKEKLLATPTLKRSCTIEVTNEQYKPMKYRTETAEKVAALVDYANQSR